MSAEARRYIRHPSTIPIEYYPQDGTRPQKQTLHDVSYGGLSFNATEPLPVGQRLALCIPSIRAALKLEATVSWCQKSDEAYLIGATFLNQRDGFAMRMVEQVCYIEQYRQQMLQEGRVLSAEEAAREWIALYAADFPGGGVQIRKP